MEDINEYFNPVHFTKFYNEKLKRKKGGGLDGFTCYLLEPLRKETG